MILISTQSERRYMILVFENLFYLIKGNRFNQERRPDHAGSSDSQVSQLTELFCKELNVSCQKNNWLDKSEASCARQLSAYQQRLLIFLHKFYLKNELKNCKNCSISEPFFKKIKEVHRLFSQLQIFENGTKVNYSQLAKKYFEFIIYDINYEKNFTSADMNLYLRQFIIQDTKLDQLLKRNFLENQYMFKIYYMLSLGAGQHFCDRTRQTAQPPGLLRNKGHEILAYVPTLSQFLLTSRPPTPVLAGMALS